ncbi:MAG: hypothetical protein ACI9UA_006083, partial [Pseudoalteromonas tetraodonis]
MIDDELPSPESKAFHTTRWTMVMRAR